jgi:hypothetical protein
MAKGKKGYFDHHIEHKINAMKRGIPKKRTDYISLAMGEEGWDNLPSTIKRFGENAFDVDGVYVPEEGNIANSIKKTLARLKARLKREQAEGLDAIAEMTKTNIDTLSLALGKVKLGDVKTW